MLEEMDEEFGISELIDQTVPIKKEVLLNGFFEDAGISKIICVFWYIQTKHGLPISIFLS